MNKKEQAALVEKEITAGLKSQNEKSIMKALRHVRKKGTVVHLPILIELLRTGNVRISGEVLKVLADVKKSSAVEVFMEHLKSGENRDVADQIACAMWQTGLNFDAYLEDFVHLAINGNFHLAMECYTLIEQCSGNYADELLLRLAADIKHALPDKDKDLRAILSDVNRHLTGRVIDG